ncbi:MAG: hypothetical protein U0992_15765 [Planctomycetaceae bacterium]
MRAGEVDVQAVPVSHADVAAGGDERRCDRVARDSSQLAGQLLAAGEVDRNIAADQVAAENRAARLADKSESSSQENVLPGLKLVNAG